MSDRGFEGFGDPGFLQQAAQERLPVACRCTVVVRVGSKGSGEGVGVALVAGEGVTDDAGEVPAVDPCRGQVLDGPDHGGDGKSVHHAPLVDPDVSAVEPDTGPSGLFPRAAGELELVGLQVAKPVHGGRGTVRHHPEVVVAQAVAGGSRRIEGEPCGAETVEWGGRRTGDPVDPVGDPFERTLAGEACDALRRHTKHSGLRRGHQPPLAGGEVGNIQHTRHHSSFPVLQYYSLRLLS